MKLESASQSVWMNATKTADQLRKTEPISWKKP